MKLRDKIFYTFSAFLMRPMLRDDPKSTEKSAKKMFWKSIKDIWTNKINFK
jgi:hypothetical protein